MPDLFADIKAFHEKFGLTYNGKPRALPPHVQKFRNRFHREELIKEYSQAQKRLTDVLKRRDETMLLPHDEATRALENMLDALVDATYVVLGTAYLHGFDFNAAWERVHAANMNKVRGKKRGDSKRKSTQDVVKPVGWQAPRLRDLVIDHAHNDA